MYAHSNVTLMRTIFFIYQILGPSCALVVHSYISYVLTFKNGLINKRFTFQRKWRFIHLFCDEQTLIFDLTDGPLLVENWIEPSVKCPKITKKYKFYNIIKKEKKMVVRMLLCHKNRLNELKNDWKICWIHFHMKCTVQGPKVHEIFSLRTACVIVLDLKRKKTYKI